MIPPLSIHHAFKERQSIEIPKTLTEFYSAGVKEPGKEVCNNMAGTYGPECCPHTWQFFCPFSCHLLHLGLDTNLAHLPSSQNSILIRMAIRWTKKRVSGLTLRTKVYPTAILPLSNRASWKLVNSFVPCIKPCFCCQYMYQVLVVRTDLNISPGVIASQ